MAQFDYKPYVNSYTPRPQGGSMSDFDRRMAAYYSQRTPTTFNNPLIPENNPYKSIQNYQTRLSGIGQPIPDRQAEGEGGFLNGLLKFLNMSGSSVTNVVHDVVKGAQTPGRQNTLGSLAKSYSQGWTGERQDTMTDIFDTVGWKAQENPQGKWYNPLSWNINNTARNVLAFAGDVAVDPLSWISFGGTTVAKNAAKGVTKEALEGLTKSYTKSIVNIAETLGTTLGRSPADIQAQALKAVGGDSRAADTLMRTAYSLGKGGTNRMNVNTMDDLLNRGFNGINGDTVSEFVESMGAMRDSLIKGVDGSTSELTKLRKSRSATLGGVFSKGALSTDAFNLYKAMNNAKSVEEFDSLVGGLNGLLASLSASTKLFRASPVYSASADMVKEIALKRIYPTLDPAGLAAKMADDTLGLDELGVIEALRTGFKFGEEMTDDAVEQLGKDIYARVNPSKLVDENLEKIAGRLDAERKVWSEVKQIDDGIEFANGLQRVYDASKKRFYLRYHNPVTNTIKPILELTPITQSPAMKAAGEKVLGLPVVSQVSDMLGYIFKPEHMGKAAKLNKERDTELAKLKGQLKSGELSKADYDAKVTKVKKAYETHAEARQAVAKKITKYLHMETAIPYQTVESAINLFYDSANKLDTVFLKDDRLRRAVTYMRQSGNSPEARVGWELMQGRNIDDVLDEMFDLTDDVVEGLDDDAIAEKAAKFLADRESLKKAFSKPEIQKFIKQNQISAKELEIVERANGKVTKYFEALKEFDEARGTVFSDVTPTEGSKGLHGFGGDADNPATNVITADNYVHAVYRSKDRDSAVVSNMHRNDTDRIKSSSSDTAGYADEKTIESMINARLYGKEPVDDILMSMSLRNLEGLRVDLNRRLVADLQRSIKQEPGMRNLISEKPIENGTKVQIGTTTFYAVPEVVNQLNRIADTFSTNLGVAQLMRYTDTVTNMMKRLQTSLNPAFIVRNAIGEPMMNWFDGVKPASWEKAYEVMNGMKAEGLVRVGDTYFHKGEEAFKVAPPAGAKPHFTFKQKEAINDGEKIFAKRMMDDVQVPGESQKARKARIRAEMEKEGIAPPIDPKKAHKTQSGTFSSDYVDESFVKNKVIEDKGIKTMTLGGKTYTYNDIMTAFRDLGLGWSGVSKGNLIENSATTIKHEVNSQVGNKAVNFMQNTGDTVETFTRLSHFIDKLEQGFGMEEAAAAVRAYHVDYRDLTVPERTVFRRLAPYYTYMRKNLPIQVQNLYTNLGRVNMVSELVRSSYDALAVNNGGLPPVVDDYLQEGLAIPLGVDEQGNIQYLNWNLPMMDLGRLRLDPGEFFDMNVLEMLHPVIKAGFELPANTSLGFNQPIEGFQGETTPFLPNTDTPQISKRTNYFINQLGVVESGRKALAQGYNALTGAEPNPLKPNQVPLMQSLFPIKNQMNTLNNQAYQYRDQLQGYIKYLEQEGTDVPTLEELSQMSQYTPRSIYRSKYLPR